MTSDELNCWRCGGALKGVPLPFGRRDDCAACGASLRACRMCEFYEPNASKACREPVADEIADKEAANFCDYFRPRPGAAPGADPEAAAAKAKLAALFGDASPPAAPGAEQAPERPKSEAAAARDKLEALFGKDRR